MKHFALDIRSDVQKNIILQSNFVLADTGKLYRNLLELRLRRQLPHKIYYNFGFQGPFW